MQNGEMFLNQVIEKIANRDPLFRKLVDMVTKSQLQVAQNEWFPSYFIWDVIDLVTSVGSHPKLVNHRRYLTLASRLAPALSRARALITLADRSAATRETQLLQFHRGLEWALALLPDEKTVG